MPDYGKAALNQTGQNNDKLSFFPINVKLPPFNAKGNANYFNAVDKKWYEDAALTKLSTDDTAAINAAIIYARNNKIKKVFVVDGNYLTTGQLTTRDNIELFGTQNALIRCSGSTTYNAITNLDPVKGNNNMYIHDLIIDVQRTNRGIGADNGSNGIRFISSDANRCENVRIENVTVKDTGHAGMYLYNLKNSIVKDNKVYDTMRDGIVVWCNSENVQLTDNSVWDAGDDCIAVNSEVTGHSGTKCVDIVIKGGKLSQRSDSIYGTGVRVAGGERVTVSAVNISDVQGHGILVEGSFINNNPSKNVTVFGNNIVNAGTVNSGGSGIAVTNAQLSSINGNTITNSYLNGIQLTGNDTSCENNKVTGGKTATTNGIVLLGTGCSARNNEVYNIPNIGIDVGNVDCQAVGNKVKDACLQTINPFIRVPANVSYTQVNNNTCRKTQGLGSYGVRLATGTGDYNIVTGNLGRGFTAGNEVSSGATGTHNVLANNSIS